GTFLIFAAFLAQKQQLKRQEAELDKQAEQFRMQHESIKLQNFENAFFQLLSQHRQILTEMRHKQAFSKDEEGTECFRLWYEHLKRHYEGQKNRKETTDEKQITIRAYDTFYQGRQHELGHYFRNLYHIIKFVNQSEALKAENVD